MCNHLNVKIFIHIFTVIYLIMIIIIMRGENFVAYLDGLGGTPVAHHCLMVISYANKRSAAYFLHILIQFNTKLHVTNHAEEDHKENS
jgi:hypothetical protein